MAYNFNFRELDVITDKYGEDVVLTENNVKDIYFLTDCNTKDDGDSEVIKYLENHHSLTDILEWNDEFVNSLLDGCSTDSDDWEDIAQTGYNLQIACRIYADERNIYKKIIDKLQAFYNKYGYFVNYYFFKKLPTYPYEDRTFNNFESIYISKPKGHGAPYSHGDERRYLTDDGYCGLMPRLYKLNYTDILNELLTKIFLPVLTHFDEFLSDLVTDTMKRLDVIYLQTGVTTDLCDYPVRKLLKEYARINAITLPKTYEKVMADFPLNEGNAKEYFFSCKCSLTKIYGRNDANAEKFKSYNLSRQTLDGWTNEWIANEIRGVTESTAAQKLLYVVHNFSDIVNVENAQKMITLYTNFKDNFKRSLRHTMLYFDETDHTTKTVRRYGLLYIAAKNVLCTYLDGLESELLTLLNEELSKDDIAIIKNSINTMYMQFGIKG